MLEAAPPRVHGRLVEGDLRQLPLDTGSQHLAWACASLLHLPKPQLRERCSTSPIADG